MKVRRYMRRRDFLSFIVVELIRFFHGAIHITFELGVIHKGGGGFGIMQTKADKGRGLMFTVFLQTSFMDDDPLGIEGAYKEADLKKLGKRL